MLKRTISIMVILLLAAMTVPVSPVLAEREPVVTVNCPVTVKLHSYPVVVVNVEDVEGLNAIQFDITYDPALLEYNSARNGQFGTTIMPVISSEETEGTLHIIGVLGSDTVSGDGYVTIINFLAKNTGTSEIGIINGIVNGTEAEIPAVWNGGSITIGTVEAEDETTTAAEEAQAAATEETADKQTADTDETVTIQQSSETQTITTGETDNAGTEKETATGTEAESIKWPIVGGIIGGAVVLLLLAILPKFFRSGGRGYLD